MSEKLQHRGQTLDYNMKKQQLRETTRHNKTQEGISNLQAMASASQAKTAVKNAQLRAQELNFAKSKWKDEVLNVRAQAAKNRADMDLATQKARTETHNTSVREVDSQFAAWEKALGGLSNASRIVGTVLKKVLD
nr:putative ORF1 [Marmot picobirnavirus]